MTTQIRETDWTTKEPLEKRAAELITRAADFTDWLDTGVTITACTVTIENAAAEDKTATMLEGVPTVASPRVTFRIKAGTAGLSYTVKFALTLSNGDTNIALKKLIVS